MCLSCGWGNNSHSEFFELYNKAYLFKEEDTQVLFQVRFLTWEAWRLSWKTLAFQKSFIAFAILKLQPIKVSTTDILFFETVYKVKSVKRWLKKGHKQGTIININIFTNCAFITAIMMGGKPVSKTFISAYLSQKTWGECFPPFRLYASDNKSYLLLSFNSPLNWNLIWSDLLSQGKRAWWTLENFSLLCAAYILRQQSLDSMRLHCICSIVLLHLF